ncbi:flagellar hook protein FlgE [Faunimonas sp. B44]|uniref:flagellar hook protein FlgE n=1 Tax=Faunimonas sp. B44 TaxID=3461493 RepID=UPI0040440EA7
MSLYTVMRAGVSGMNAQSNRLSAVADNIANSDTDGYKRAVADFSSMVVRGGAADYQAGGVASRTTYAISEQGSIQYTASATDLAVSGKGFMVVSDQAGNSYLTRAGSFVPDSNGNLVNAAGYYLMGYPLENGDATLVANGLAGMERVSISDAALAATPSRSGRLVVNLPVAAEAVAAGSRPSDNQPDAAFAAKTSLVAYDNLGGEVLLDVYYTKTDADTWEVAVFDRSTAADGGGFPYSSGPLAVEGLSFDPATGALTGASPSSLSFAVPNGAAVTVDLAGTTQLAAGYTMIAAVLDGNAPSAIETVEITGDGTLYAVYENGSRLAVYTIPLADVPSPDNLTPLSGNVFAINLASGDVRVGVPGAGGFGTMISGAIEKSNVDLASELTSMIEAQRGYTANSKVFQTGADLLDVLVNLKR